MSGLLASFGRQAASLATKLEAGLPAAQKAASGCTCEATSRQWLIQKLKCYPPRLTKDIADLAPLKDTSSWTVADAKRVGKLATNFLGFFVLGEIFSRGAIGGYPVPGEEKEHAHH
eukprot:TRINITY_DN23009_c0_g1_i1.p2 TRINITY_DN23009_c0_g1~~TRINITY_DN23009_c0_g1_i1.p2  ORF type:complete len:116 (+),score=47.45 TRINITY_DN23009_c0_g1_i1:22-369(+)